jgi:hypothetical protein
MFIGAVLVIVAMPFVVRWPYQVVIIDLAVQTASLAVNIIRGDRFWIAVNGSLIGVLIVVLFFVRRPPKRRRAPKVIGDESRRVRDGLVRTLRERASPSSP